MAGGLLGSPVLMSGVLMLNKGTAAVVRGRSLASALDIAPQYSRQRCMPLKHSYRIYIGAVEIETLPSVIQPSCDQSTLQVSH